MINSESSRHRSSSAKPSSAPINTPAGTKHRDGSKNRSHSGTPTSKSRDGSPRVNIRSTSEDIPMENLNSSPSSSRCSSTVPSRSHTPSRLTTDSSNGLTLTIAKEILPTTATTPNGDIVRQRSEETSFMSNSEERRKKGAIETV